MKEKALKAIKLKGRVDPDQKLVILKDAIELPEGDVEIILIYDQSINDPKRHSIMALPTLDGKRYLGGSLRREEIYGDDGR